MLGSLPDHEGYSEGLGVSLDGQVVVGLARGFIVPTCGDWVDDHNVAFIWDPANGMRELKSVLVGYGLDLTGWELYEARSISSDGTVICGIGTHNGVAEGWVATIGRLGPMSACCDADLNCTDETQPDCEDGGGTYRAGKHCDTYTCCHTPYADSDGDGDVDQIDFAVFQLCYTGSGGGVPTGCKCWNRDQDNDVDAADFTAFNHCWTGPNVQFDPENPGSCVTD